ncbi:MAG: DNA polymerase III subunit epsilon [Gammaproteobacteria bacterium]|nr:DNA polymerase III subunit epsilon [Gammaproteobacteria bacterium]MBU1413983.1 DNA polymerase III subunit epsilon [Gammaproteobacteria bacterium]
MNARLRFVLAVVALGLLMTGPFLLTAAVLVAELKPAELAELEKVLLPRLPIGVLMTVLGLGIGIAVLRNLFRQYVQGLLGMAEKLRLMHSANRSFRVEVAGPPEVRQLAEAANELAQQRDDLLTDVDAMIARARASVEEEKNRLAALVADLPQPVIVCNLDGRILLYNNRARLQARALVPDAKASGALIGLGRSIHAVFDPSLIGHALETLQHRLERKGSQPLAHFVTATRAGQLIRVQMAPVLGADPTERNIRGYVLMLENISRFIEADAACDHSVQKLANESRSALAGIRAALSRSGASPSFAADIAREVDTLTQRVNEATSEYADSVKARWPLEEMRGDDLISAIRRRIEIKTPQKVRIDSVAPELWVKVDSYSLVQAVTFLAARLADDYDVRVVRLRIESIGAMVAVDLLWTGTSISTEILIGWQMEMMSVGDDSSPLTLRDVTDRHGGELTCSRESASQQSRFRLLIPVAVGQDIFETPLMSIESRPEFYDFDLFHRGEEDHALDDRPLRELAYTAFDTETTGLEPSNGDEIIQFGAVRIVNGRLLRHECIDQVVDPQRRIKPEGIPIHGITEEMVAGQPTIATVLPQFHRFCEDTVLIAHNAAFDMRFLQLKEEATGIRFNQPLLDTLLLSAVVHPNQESHKLEAIAERLGIPVIGRHNALGDAIVTGEIFLRMIPLLEAMGLKTLKQAREAAEKTYYARVKY